MFPNAPDFRTSNPQDGWFVDRSAPGNAAGESEDICQVSGAFFLRALSLFVRMQMRSNAARNPYIINGTRYALDAMIDREFLAPTAWTRTLLLAYNEYLNRANRTTSRAYIETDAVTRELLLGLVNGSILNAPTTPYTFLTATQWQGRFSTTPPEGFLRVLPENALLPVMGAQIGPSPWPARLSLGCTGRGNLDPSYLHPAERTQGSGLTTVAAVLGIGLLLAVASRR